MRGFRAEGRNVTIGSLRTGKPPKVAQMRKSREGLCFPWVSVISFPYAAITYISLLEKEQFPAVFKNWELGHFC